MQKKNSLQNNQPAKANLNLIQVLRGIASLLVVLFHTTVNLNSSLKTSFFFNAFNFGGAGVDIFFVLSGFIITYTSLKMLHSSNKPVPFLRRRFVRIFPTYWIVITFFLVIQLVFPSFYSSGTYEFSLSNIFTTYFLFPGHIMVNGVSWTLSYELFFYLLFSLAFVIPQKKTAVVLAMLYAFTIVLLYVFGYNAETQNSWLMLITFPMNTEFIMGIAAALVIPHIPGKLSLPLIIAGSVLFIAGGFFINTGYSIVLNGFNRVIIFGIPSFLIITGVVKFELMRPVKVHNILLQLGEASYSLYLLHLPIIVACIKIIQKLHIQNSLLIHFLLCFIIIVICFGSIVFFRIIERPLIKKLNSYGKTFFK